MSCEFKMILRDDIESRIHDAFCAKYGFRVPEGLILTPEELALKKHDFCHNIIKGFVKEVVASYEIDIEAKKIQQQVVTKVNAEEFFKPNIIIDKEPMV